MTSRQQRSLLVALLLILGLFLVACERPMPGDNEVLPTITPADDTEYSSAAEEIEVAEADLVQPSEGEISEDEVLEGVAAESDAAVGETAESEAAESDAAEVDTAESDTAESEAVESDAAEVDAAESDTAESEAAESDAAEIDVAEGEGADASEENSTGETGRTHTVAAGENLFRISMQYGISWVTLAQVNGLTNADSISVGQILIIPDEEIDETSETPESTEPPATEDTAEESEESEEQEPVESETVDAASKETTHIVQSGENLYRISLQFGVSMMEIARTNGLEDFNQVFEGQELIIPQAELIDNIDTERKDKEATHLVQEGETVFGIAFQYGIAWTKLVDANDIPSPYNLEVGQSLIIPSSE